MSEFILALDQGTTSSRALVFDRSGGVVALDQYEFPQHFRQPGWVEHDADEIWDSQLRAARGAIEKAGIQPSQIAGIGITNQRETTVVWDRDTGRAIHPAIVWQSRQTAGICESLREQGLEAEATARTGLVIDSYFSGTKVRFILDAVEGAQARAERGELCFGTVDSYLLYRLTGGRVHATEYSNASRTLLYNIHDLEWDDTMLGALDVPRAMLPEVRDSSGVFGTTSAEWFGAELPVAGMAGDQQSSLFGQGCFEPGSLKNTYGTGCFLLMNTGAEARASENGLLTTLAWGLDGQVEYALEGSVFVAGAAIQWLRDGLELFEDAADSEALATSVDDTGGVYFVPALTGLGAPYWDERARGTIVGLTRGTKRAHLVRAALEAIAFSSRDVVDCMARDSGLSIERLKVDGGACRNDFLMQFQADLLGAVVERPSVLEVTAFGAAALAGLAVGLWADRDDLRSNTAVEGGTSFQPKLAAPEREAVYSQWQRAVDRSRDWHRDEA